jgi:succinate dehydrogenase / fumarate reductase cytochrome b subunit
MYWLLNSSVGKKLVMSVSGVFLVLFLLFHMTMNLTLVFSVESYDGICELLGANWYAIAGTLVLAGGFVVHIAYGTLLTLQNQRARGANSYASSSRTPVEWSAKNMYVLGFIVLAGIVLHLWHFWYNMQFKELFHLEGAVSEGSGLVIVLFSNPIYSLIYLLWFTAIWFHLTHGVWSAFQTLGLNNRIWFPRLKFVANTVATLICIGFAVVPVYFTILAWINY